MKQLTESTKYLLSGITNIEVGKRWGIENEQWGMVRRVRNSH